VSVLLLETDVWIAYSLFTGLPRTTPYGPMSGMWHGYIEVVGDASGGTTLLGGLISNGKKRQYVHLVEGISVSHTGAVGADNFTLDLFGGPRLNTNKSANQIPTFTLSGDLREGVDRSSWPGTQGGDHFRGMPLFTDTKGNLSYTMVQCQFNDNTNNETYRLAMWGWVLGTQEFYRGFIPG